MTKITTSIFFTLLGCVSATSFAASPATKGHCALQAPAASLSHLIAISAVVEKKDIRNFKFQAVGAELIQRKNDKFSPDVLETYEITNLVFEGRVDRNGQEIPKTTKTEVTLSDSGLDFCQVKNIQILQE